MPELRSGGRSAGRPEPPFVLVVGAEDDPLVRAALAGLEEEGVPGRLVPPSSRGAEVAAREAATTSPLEVGLAVVEGSLCLTHAKFPPGSVVHGVRGASLAEARSLGHDAARIVTGVPLGAGAGAGR